MQFYLSSADLREIRAADATGFVAEVFVPRADVMRSGRDYHTLLRDVAMLHFGWVGAQADAFDAETLVNEARLTAEITGEAMSFLMPMTLESIRAGSICRRADLQVGLRQVSSLVQALVAARGGADDVVLDAVQLGAAGVDVPELVHTIHVVFQRSGIAAQLLVDCVRDAGEAARIALAGGSGVICEWDVLQRFACHPFTDLGIDSVLAQSDPQTL